MASAIPGSQAALPVCKDAALPPTRMIGISWAATGHPGRCGGLPSITLPRRERCHWGILMGDRVIGLFAATVCLLLAPCGAQAFDESKYPDLKGQWERVGAPRWLAPGQKAPLTPEYQAINDAQLADQAAGGQGNWPSSFCIPQGMPAIMNLYDPMEIVAIQDTTYILISYINDYYRR